VVDEVVKVLDFLGYGKVILKSDGEYAILALIRAVKERRQAETIIDDSRSNIDGSGLDRQTEIITETVHPGDKQSNGAAEKAIQEVEGLLRTRISHLSARYGLKVTCDMHIMSWLVKHVGTIISRFKVGEDGLTPYQRLKGKKAPDVILPFGEKVLWMPGKSSRGKLEKLEPRYYHGVWVGMVSRTNEFVIITRPVSRLQGRCVDWMTTTGGTWSSSRRCGASRGTPTASRAARGP
jgi:hypothetical protein